MEKLKYNKPFTTETGAILPSLEIAYNKWGTLNADADNVIWVCHALTANSDVESWWPGMVGEGLLFDPGKYFIICANVLGSCYGTTGPASLNPETGKPWLNDFPLITVRDLVNVHEILRKHLGIKKIHTIIGASIGGYQALEYTIMFPDLVKRLILLASGARQTPWALAFSESMRLAMQADQTFTSGDPDGGKLGLKAARSIALISYRTMYAYNQTQKDDDNEKLTSFRAASYQAYQGEKLVKRFNPYSYWCLTCLSDTHNIGRSRGGIINALKKIKANVLCVGIRSDILFPTDDQKFITANTEGAEYIEIDSFYGHDGFLIETDIVTDVVSKFWEKTINGKR
ncbi:MAG: homoserine O-acetyltransferase [Bacteroidales bacterium]|jgi:homoserine O-acetyltransferase|nr:homoserine O-acetyltransferase [Bacteroidales bacterium]